MPQDGIVIMTKRYLPDGSEDPRIGLAHFKLTKEHLRVETLSEPRLAKARRLLDDAVGHCVVFESEEVRGPEEYVSLEDDEDSEPGPARLTEQEEAVEARRHAEQWLKTPVPALRGKSPEQAAGEPVERPVLERLLKSYEHSVHAELKRGGRLSLFSLAQTLALRELLGLPPSKLLEAPARRYRLLLDAAESEAGDPDAEESGLWTDYKRALALQKKGRLREAARAYEALKDRFRAHDSKFRLWSNLGMCYVMTGELDKGIRCFETSLEVRPDYQMARDNLAKALALKDLPPEEREAIPINPRWSKEY